jgi:hypothetical protein
VKPAKMLESIRMAVAAAVKGLRSESVAAAAPQKIEATGPELSEKRRVTVDDERIPPDDQGNRRCRSI